MQNKIEHLYFDMDGLLCNFNKKCIEIMGHVFDEENAKKCWKKISETSDFWISLECYDKLDQFLDTIIPILNEKNINYHILTGTSSSSECERDKIIWVNKNISKWFQPHHVHLCKSKNKKFYATPNSILIDDRPSNIEDWSEHGGVSIWHNSDHETYDELLQKIIAII